MSDLTIQLILGERHRDDNGTLRIDADMVREGVVTSSDPLDEKEAVRMVRRIIRDMRNKRDAR